VKLVVQELTIAAPTEVVYRGLDGPMAGAHEGGWQHYLDRLRRAAVGDDPGPDPFASVRVPTPAELGVPR
jgi:hypothetical protein